MKQLTILSGKAMIVELPEGVTNPRIWPESPDRLYVDDPLGYDGVDQIDLPPGTWQIVGMLPEVTESDAAGVVRKVTMGYWMDYTSPNKRHDYMCKSALESLESAILAEGYGFDSEPEPSYSDCEQYENPLRTYEGRLREWNSRQSRVLCRERTLILKKTS